MCTNWNMYSLAPDCFIWTARMTIRCSTSASERHRTTQRGHRILWNIPPLSLIHILCEIYTDVEGVYSADPRVVPNAVKMKEISNEEMLELARLGAGVMQPQSISMGSRFHVPIHVRSTFSDNEGTIIREDNFGEEKGPVCGVAEDYNVARIAAVGVENVPGTAAKMCIRDRPDTVHRAGLKQLGWYREQTSSHWDGSLFLS